MTPKTLSPILMLLLVFPNLLGNINPSIYSAIVRIETQGGNGTGFVVHIEKGDTHQIVTIVTAAHVVQPISKNDSFVPVLPDPKVIFPWSQEEHKPFDINNFQEGHGVDLCYLKVRLHSSIKVQALIRATSAPVLSQRVTMIGYPGNTETHVQKMGFVIKNENAEFIVDFPTLAKYHGGFSGSPLITDGELVAMIIEQAGDKIKAYSWKFLEEKLPSKIWGHRSCIQCRKPLTQFTKIYEDRSSGLTTFVFRFPQDWALVSERDLFLHVEVPAYGNARASISESEHVATGGSMLTWIDHRRMSTFVPDGQGQDFAVEVHIHQDFENSTVSAYPAAQ